MLIFDTPLESIAHIWLSGPRGLAASAKVGVSSAAKRQAGLAAVNANSHTPRGSVNDLSGYTLRLDICSKEQDAIPMVNEMRSRS